MNKQKRMNSLIPAGVPKWIRCYDDGGDAIDRYTVVFTHAQSFYTRRWTPYLAMSAYPFHPQGFGQHGDTDHPIDRPNYGHLGKRIKFEDLPEDCKKLVRDDYRDYWGL